MTRTETAELHELNMSPEALAERQAKVSAMLTETANKEPKPIEPVPLSALVGLLKPTRRPRSDKGKPKPPKPVPQAPGALTPEQAVQIQRLYTIASLAQETYVQARLELVILADKAELAHQAAVAYLETLTFVTPLIMPVLFPARRATHF